MPLDVREQISLSCVISHDVERVILKESLVEPHQIRTTRYRCEDTDLIDCFFPLLGVHLRDIDLFHGIIHPIRETPHPVDRPKTPFTDELNDLWDGQR